ncbi:DoxX family membrane protein [Gramella sp. BOM4]|nr:DoxX family membrane protein [Christiangramia bathymodioli]
MKIEAIISRIRKLDYKISRWMYVYGKSILRYALAVIFIWFGALKITGDSPASNIVEITVFWFDPEVFIPILGIWEVLIGVCLLFKKLIRLALLLLVFQMPGTFLPLIIHPDICFIEFPFKLSMEGQYIIKNLIIIGAAIVTGGSVKDDEFVERDVKPSNA